MESERCPGTSAPTRPHRLTALREGASQPRGTERRWGRKAQRFGTAMFSAAHNAPGLQCSRCGPGPVRAPRPLCTDLSSSSPPAPKQRTPRGSQQRKARHLPRDAEDHVTPGPGEEHQGLGRGSARPPRCAWPRCAPSRTPEAAAERRGPILPWGALRNKRSGRSASIINRREGINTVPASAGERRASRPGCTSTETRREKKPAK